MMFKLNRDKVIVSSSGHSIEFKKGVATHVPHGAIKDVLAAGAEPQEELDDEPESTSPEPADPAKRAKLIKDTLAQMAKENKRDDFTATGVPTKAALDGRLGFKVDAKEREQLWTEFKQG